MTRPSTTRPTLIAAALSLVLAAAISLASAPARAADDEEVPIDTKILRGLMESLGLERDGQGINYQERAPLVIPPSKSLPPPETSSAAIANNPAWPKDPDVLRAKQEAAAERKASLSGSDQFLRDERPLNEAELTPGPKPRSARRSGSATGSSALDEKYADPLKPSELGYKGGIFSTMFGKESTNARFTGEPARTSLTEPPPGYQTPSPDQPYGLGTKALAPKAQDYLTTHVEGEK